MCFVNGYGASLNKYTKQMEMQHWLTEKKWTSVTKQLHSLYRSSQMLQKWQECSLQSEVEIGNGGKYRKVAVVYCRAAYAEFLNRKATGKRNVSFDEPSHFEQGPVHFVTKEARGKIRDLSGWVISEERKACMSYISRHKCSKSNKVLKEVEVQRKIKSTLDKLIKGQKYEILDGSKYPESLEHTTLYDRGGKTYVTYAVFEFFVEVSSLASHHFSDKYFHALKQNALSVAYSQMQSNAILLMAA